MSRYFVLFSIPARVIDHWRETTPPEQMKAASEQMMGDWQKWMAEHGKNIVDRGAPLGKTKRVTSGGTADIRNDLNWYLIVEGESHDAVAQMFAVHPHLRIPEAAVEIMAIPETVGM